MANYARGYSVFDAVRAKVRSQATGQTRTSAEGYGAKPGDTGLRTGVPGSVGVGMYDSPFLSETPGDPSPYAMSPTGDVVSFTENPELRAVEGMQPISGAEAAAKSNLGTYGPDLGSFGKFDPTSGFGRAVNSLFAGIDPTPFGAFTSFVSGTTTVDPYGKLASKPTGFLGMLSEGNIQRNYEVAEKIRAGTPGFHQFYSGGSLVSIVPGPSLLDAIPNDFGNYTVAGVFSGSPRDAVNQYAAAMGYDPETVNLQSRPGMDNFGRPLDAFVPGSGGFREDGKFVDVSGKAADIAGADLEAHLGLTADIYGIPTAVNTINNMGVSKDVANQMMQSLRSGELTAQAVVDKDGNTIGYNTGSGSVVRSKDGIVTSQGGNPVTAGAGIMSTSLYESLKAEAEFMAETGAGGAFETGSPVSGFAEISGGDGGESDGPDYSQEGREATSRGETFFAEGGEVPPDQVPPGDAPVAAQAGFIGQEPEGLPDGMTVADDVPLEVPEGTFVLNAAAVEFMGSADVKKMILEAMQEAEKQGVDIKQQNDTIPKEDLVSLVVSKGEVIIPPQLAEIIGYDRLNKINNRGKAEVERRVKESEQQEAPAPKPQILAKSGGFISKPA